GPLRASAHWVTTRRLTLVGWPGLFAQALIGLPRGDSRWSGGRASSRKRSSGGPPLAVTACQLREHAPEGNAPAGEQHHAVKPQVGGLRDHPLVTLSADRGGHDLDGLLADLPADLRLPVGEE